jgi:hypothetical protein
MECEACRFHRLDWRSCRQHQDTTQAFCPIDQMRHLGEFCYEWHQWTRMIEELIESIREHS